MKRLFMPLICLMSTCALAQPVAVPAPGPSRPGLVEPTAPPDTPQTPSPFDKDDPAIARIKSLDWKTADFNALDLRTQCAAMTALNRGLFNLGVTADQRLELLVHYLDDHDLGSTYATDKVQIPNPPQPTFAQLQQLAAAYATSPDGSAAMSTEYQSDSQAMLQQYLTMYGKSAQRELEETYESRVQVRSMALFLQNQGKLEDFKKWAPGERKRLDAQIASQQQFQQQQLTQQQQQQQIQQQQQQLTQQQQQLQQQQQMAAALSNQQYQQTPSESYTTDTYPYPYDYDGWWGGVGVYNANYYNNAYRGNVRDQTQNAYNRWNNNRNVPGRGGGGIQRGGGGGGDGRGGGGGGGGDGRGGGGGGGGGGRGGGGGGRR